jgi:epoxyqueuosine reductase
MAAPDSTHIVERLEQKAKRLGFQLFGITSPEPPSHLDIYKAWIEAGYHGEMDYLATAHAIDRRSDLKAIHPECQSVVVLSTPYRPELSASLDARVASYALGRDYHAVVNERATELVKFLESEMGRAISHRVYTDTGPILERELAQRAGLGWIGKNTCLINPEQGSYFFLTVILLQAELPVNEPFINDHCGSCRRCIEACPTTCIREDRTLEANRCISYLTIELRGPIPDDLRGEVGNWIFGCDVCQDVCPWNLRFASQAEDPAFQPRDFLDPPNIIDFLELDSTSYQSQLRESPLKRPKLAGLRRNAAIAAGNGKLQKAVDSLSKMLIRGDSTIERGHAAWALGQIGGQEVRAALESALRHETDAQVKLDISRALSVD